MRISTRIRTVRRGTWLVVAALAGIGLVATVDALRDGKDAPTAARQAATEAEQITAEEASVPPPPVSAGYIEGSSRPQGRANRGGHSALAPHSDRWLGTARPVG